MCLHCCRERAANRKEGVKKNFKIERTQMHSFQFDFRTIFVFLFYALHATTAATKKKKNGEQNRFTMRRNANISQTIRQNTK